MGKFLKILKYLFINVIFLIFVFYLVEYLTYYFHLVEHKKSFGSVFEDVPKFVHKKNPTIDYEYIEYYFTGEDNYTYGRLPDGLEFSGDPIVIFGCSYSYGWSLNKDQTFSYKLAHLLHRPVYNRSVSGQSFQQMYYQTQNPYFYLDVPKSDTVIYVLMEDHYRRMYIDSLNVLFPSFLLHYNIKNNELVYENFSNKFLKFLKSLYFSRYLNLSYYNNFINNEKNADKITDDTLLFFIKSREALEKNWKNKINFYVIFYNNNILYSNMLKKKLQDNGFIVLETSELTDKDLFNPKYYSDENRHPTEAVWDLLTPLIAKEIK